MDVARLAFWMSDFSADFIEVEGLIFLDRHARGPQGIREASNSYASLRDAQGWINTVPISDFLNEALGETWSLDDPALDELLEVYKRVWLQRLASAHPGVSVHVEIWKDPESTEVGLKLTQP